MTLILVYVTNPSLAVARRITKHLLSKKLIACANLFPSPIYSMYTWKGKLKQGKEWLAILKTSSSKFEAVKKEIEKIHPYEVPCIVKIPTSANKAFEKWVAESVL
ncbi:MAG: divalent-cation tolerance protein CutA [Nanoarchaeota archaeon]